MIRSSQSNNLMIAASLIVLQTKLKKKFYRCLIKYSKFKTKRRSKKKSTKSRTSTSLSTKKIKKIQMSQIETKLTPMTRTQTFGKYPMKQMWERCPQKAYYSVKSTIIVRNSQETFLC